MTRLNRNINNRIVDNAISKAGIDKQQEKLVKDRANWVEKVRVKSLGGAEAEKKIRLTDKRLSKIMSQFSGSIITTESVFRHDYDIILNIAGKSFTANYNGYMGYSAHTSRTYKISPSGRFVLKANDPLALEFTKLESRQVDIDKKIDKIRSNILGILTNVRTVKQLIDQWPEAKELLPDDMSPLVAQLPAVKTKDLNKMIGLPSE